MDQDTIAQFCAVTNAEPPAAEKYLEFTGGDLDTAVMMFFETGGRIPDDAPAPRPGNGASAGQFADPIDVDDTSATPEDDETMAKRLAQEWGGAQPEVRAPIAPTRQVLQDAMSGFPPFDMQTPFAGRAGNPSSFASAARSSTRGVFNQAAPSVWDEERVDDVLLETTGGASAQSSKSSRLARLFQPPFDIMSIVDFDSAKSEARSSQKWLMVNLHDNSDFSSQVLNRDLWKDKTVKSVIKESFIFLQYVKDSDDGAQYIQFYPFESYPHVAIIDPRTGERVKSWSDSISPMEFVSDVTEFLDRYSLDDTRQNPVTKRARAPPKALDQMSEEDQLNAAILASVGATPTSSEGQSNGEQSTHDPAQQGGPAPAKRAATDSRFAAIPAVAAPEPAAGPDSTRIQLRLPSSRIIRRFLLSDPVQRIFEFVKAETPEALSKDFKIIFNRANLLDQLESTIQQAGLKNSSLVVEFLEDDAAGSL